MANIGLVFPFCLFSFQWVTVTFKGTAWQERPTFLRNQMLLCVFVIFTGALSNAQCIWWAIKRWRDCTDKMRCMDLLYGVKPEPVRISIIVLKDFLILSHVIILVWGVPDQSAFSQIFFIRFYTRSIGEQETILNTALWVNRYLFSHRSIKPSASAAGKPVANSNQ